MNSRKLYLIIVPIYNEEDSLDFVLKQIKSIGYLNRIIFVNDGSTDKTEAILNNWKLTDDICFYNLSQNLRKEGAILAVLNKLKLENELPANIILMDSDSFLVATDLNCDFNDAVIKALSCMNQQGVSAMAFRMDPLILTRVSLLHKAQSIEYVGMYLWNLLHSRWGKLWVINGPGGIFRTNILYSALQQIPHEFDTGDLLLTVKLMKNNYKLAIYTDIRVKTIIPNTIKELFIQRRRWIRGTLKVLLLEGSFYSRQFFVPGLIAMHASLILFMNFLLLNSVLDILDNGFQTEIFVKMYFSTVILNVLYFLFQVQLDGNKNQLELTSGVFLQGLLCFFVMLPANVIALFDIFRYLIQKEWQRIQKRSFKVSKDVINAA